jgi:uncharacterized protein YqjF (DUF2071 family)
MDDWIRRQLIDRQLPVDQKTVMFQRWEHLLFLHWAVKPDLIQATLPSGLEVDTFSDTAWVGIVPFFMGGVRPVGLPAVPGLSDFLELNVRTYVRDRYGRPGIWFYSLDANQPIAVVLARLLFALPYLHARMQAVNKAGTINYTSTRYGSLKTLQYVYRAGRNAQEAPFGSLEFFLVERYRLFAFRQDQLWTGRVYHTPYRVTKPIVHQWSAGLFELDGLEEPDVLPDHALYSRRVDVSIYPLLPA